MKTLGNLQQWMSCNTSQIPLQRPRRSFPSSQKCWWLWSPRESLSENCPQLKSVTLTKVTSHLWGQPTPSACSSESIKTWSSSFSLGQLCLAIPPPELTKSLAQVSVQTALQLNLSFPYQPPSPQTLFSRDCSTSQALC